MVHREQLWGAPRGNEHWRAPRDTEKVALDLFCAKNKVGFRSFESNGFLPTKDYRGPPWSEYSEVQSSGYVVNVRNSGKSTDEKQDRQDSAPLFISNAYNTMRARPRRSDERGPCRKNDCCLPCEVNYYKDDIKQESCKEVEEGAGTKLPFGNTAALSSCIEGTEMKYCIRRTAALSVYSVDDCWRDPPNVPYWKTCVPCNSIETPQKDEYGVWRCMMCNEGQNITGEYNYAAGEYYENRACHSCNECSVFEPAPQWSTFSATTSDTDKKTKMWDKEYEDALLNWNHKPAFAFQSRWRTRTFIPRNALACKVLERRELDASSTVDSPTNFKGQDFFRDESRRTPWKGQFFGKTQVTGHYAIHYNFLVNKTKTCTMKHCKEYCQRIINTAKDVARRPREKTCGCGKKEARRVWSHMKRKSFWTLRMKSRGGG
jgi:hypothetical protein